MEEITLFIDFILKNYEWLFSGIGLSALGLVGYIFFRKKSEQIINQKIISGNSSSNVQIGKINEK